MDELSPQKVAAWLRAHKLPHLEAGVRHELLTMARAIEEAIRDDERSIPREVRVYYQALKYILHVADVPPKRTGKPEARTKAITDEQLQVATSIDAKVQRLRRAGTDDVTLIGEMSEDMPKFKWLLDTVPPGGMDDLCQKLGGFYHYSLLLSDLAAGIASGSIRVP